MGRDIDESRRPEVEKARSEQPHEHREPEVESRERRSISGRGYVYCLSQSEIKTMTNIGQFRTIDERDLEQYRYRKNREHMRDDLRSLQNQGLLQRRTIWTGNQGDRLTVFVLTKRGKAFLEKENNPGSEQKIFAGFVKPAEVRHDAAIYRMYQAEANRIERSGGRIKRVVLDYELKQKVYQPLAKERAKAKPTCPDYLRRQSEIASQNRLKVVHGKILLPDLRIEFETSTGDRTHVDLELATHHYRGSSLRAKAEAGFKMYASQDSVAGLTAALDPEFTTEIFSF